MPSWGPVHVSQELFEFRAVEAVEEMTSDYQGLRKFSIRGCCMNFRADHVFF